MLLPATIKFLKDLEMKDDKSWFDAPRRQDAAAKKNFEQFIQAVIDKHGNQAATIKERTAKECMFRINRDVRFSTDKSPYKTNFGASINRGGKKSRYAGYYFHLEPGNSFIGGGIWMPEPKETVSIRQEIDYNLEEFKQITSSRKFVKVYNGLERAAEYSLVKIPKGYEKDNPAAEFLKLKSWLATRPLLDEELQSKSLLKITVDAFETLQPLLMFLNR